MRPLRHIIVSLVLGIVIFIFTKSFWNSVIAFLSGVFIDLDHLIDYWALKPKKPFSPKDFLDSEKYDWQKKYIFVFLHAWELVIILWLIDYLLGWPYWLLSLTLGITLHLIMDISNIKKGKMSPLTYFIIFRAFKKFRKDKTNKKGAR